MISRVTEQSLPQFQTVCGIEHVFGSRCLTAFRAYGHYHPDVTFWLAWHDDTPSAAICMLNNSLTIVSDNRMDARELSEFICSRSIQEVRSNYEQVQQLHSLLGGTVGSSYYMVYPGEKIPGDYSTVVPFSSLKDVYGILEQSHEYYRSYTQYNSWAEDFSRKLDRRLIEVYQINQDGNPAATACLFSQDDECGVIAYVAVVPAYRSQGLHELITGAMVNRILDLGKTPRLISSYDSIADLYRKVGFQEAGRWGEIFLNA